MSDAPATTTPTACSGKDWPALTVPEIEALPLPELVRYHRRGVENFDPRLFWCDPEQQETAFLPEAAVGTWPIRVLLGHLADAELVNVHRMRRAVAEDRPMLALWDENAFVDANVYGLSTSGPATAPAGAPHPIAGFVATIHVLRQWHSDWLATLQPEQWERVALHPERGAMSVRRIAALNAWHLEHHARFLALKLDRLGLVRPVGKAAGGSCGTGCGCAPGDAPAAE